MCGRFYLTASPAEIRKLFKLEKVPELVPRYNIAPMQTAPIIVAEENGRAVLMARWGLVPAWSRDLSLGAGMINAPADSFEEKPAYRTAFQSQRCLVPANGFYEWQAKGARKQPYKIALRAGALIAFAGLWARWTPEGGDPVDTFTIVTTRASKLVSEVHDRMPVILSPTDHQRWLTAPPATAKKLLLPYMTGLTITPVGDRVNSVKNDDVTLLQPASRLVSSLHALIQDLVIANRILAKEDVVDAYGHVSIRHPDSPNRFLIACSLAPELVTADEIVELGLDGRPLRDDGRALYLERFIHAAIFEARPDVMAVVHAHAEDTLPFGIADATPLRPVIHSGSFIGSEVPVWDIADNFGDTNLLVTNIEQGRDLAKCLGGNNVALMRGHGFASAGRSLIEVVRMSVYLPRNARALMRAKQVGGTIKYLSQGEIDARNRGYSPYSTETWRAWQYWASKAGCSHLLTRPEERGEPHDKERGP